MTVLNGNNLKNIFADSLKQEFKGLEAAMETAEKVRQKFENYALETRSAAEVLLAGDYRSFHAGNHQEKRFAGSYPVVFYHFQEMTNPRHLLQTIEFVKLKVVNKMSTLDDIATAQYSTSHHRRFLSLTYNMPTGKVLLHNVKVIKGQELVNLILERTLPVHQNQQRLLLDLIQEEILDWVMENAPKHFMDKVVPEVARLQGNTLDRGAAPNIG